RQKGGHHKRHGVATLTSGPARVAAASVPPAAPAPVALLRPAPHARQESRGRAVAHASRREAKGLKRQRHSNAVLATHRDELALDVEPEEFPPRRRRPMATWPRLVPQAPAARRHVTSPSPQPLVVTCKSCTAGS
ncbi:MAG: hypothetical protein ACPIOQ_36535, partial [Promethearchaeia archaeon]